LPKGAKQVLHAVAGSINRSFDEQRLQIKSPGKLHIAQLVGQRVSLAYSAIVSSALLMLYLECSFFIGDESNASIQTKHEVKVK
jgi:hypothetical protein